MAKKAESKHSIEGIISETYPYKEDGSVRLAIDGDMTRLETYVPIEFGETLKMGDKVLVTIEKANS
jgi:hypothetical protein